MFQEYFNNIQKVFLESRETSEMSYRLYLQNLLNEFIEKSINKELFIVHEPLNIEGWGRPDFKVKTKYQLNIGLIETKTIGENLNNILSSEQLRKYKKLSDNIIITNYLDFWLIRNEEVILASSICQDFDLSKKNYKVLPTRIEELSNLFKQFFESEPNPVQNSRELAERLSNKAILLREFCYDIVANEEQHTKLHAMKQAFELTLLPDITPKLFSDIYAQTVAYSIYLAGLNCDSVEKQLDSTTILKFLPDSLPLIKEIFHQFEIFPDNIKWAINEIINIIKVTDYGAIHKEFNEYKNKDKGFSDPYIYFYEDFLYHYDKDLRKIRGVYYTPESVVFCINNFIQDILINEFGIADGFFGKEVTVLDFACGTGTFLLNVFNLAIERAKKYGNEIVGKMLNEQMINQFFGFEYLVAPYVISHLKINEYLKLNGYEIEPKNRLRIYLTNTLINKELKPFDFMPSLTDEGKQANKIKNDDILVILGNPPYSGHSANKGEWIEELIKDYYYVDNKRINEKNPKWLKDDYVKFIRFAQWKMEKVERGIVGIITNHSYLDNPTFRGMRQSLMNTFNKIFIIDLHGNSKKKEKCPDGSKDENVFDIQQGVSIAIFIKDGTKQKGIYHTDIWGVRKAKYEQLWQFDKHQIRWEKISPKTPFYLFKPRNEKLLEKYNKGWSLTKIFKKSSVGIVTSRDHFVIDFDRNNLEKRIKDFIDPKYSDDEIKHYFNLRETDKFKIGIARGKIKELNREEFNSKFLKINYRPFDSRHIFYDNTLIERTRKDIMLNIQEENVALITNRNTKISEINSFFVTNIIIDAHIVDNIAYSFPLYLLSNGEEKLFFGVKEPESEYGSSKRTKHGLIKIENFTDEFRNFINKKYNTYKSPEQILGYIYAILHSNHYRNLYIDFLKVDFPKIPFVDDEKLFSKLSVIGIELIDYHLLRKVSNFDFCKFYGSKTQIEKIDYNNGKVIINNESYFYHIPENVWTFYIGGYKVLEKWLKERHKNNHNLNTDDIKHFINVVYILSITQEKMNIIDKLIENLI